MKKLSWLISIVVLLGTQTATAADISAFFGNYTGSASVEHNGESSARDMSVIIEKSRSGFTLTWESITRKSDGRLKAKKYTIDFLPSPRDDIYSSAMKTNVFGKPVPLDPLKGDPYVWSRLTGDTLTVFSMTINEDGGYEVQEYERTLATDGLQLEYRRIRDGVPLKNISAFLKRK